MIGTIAIQKIREEKEKFIDLAQKMWENPETAYNEVKACAWTAELMKEYGFEVEVGAYGLPTCVVARYGSGHPVVGLLGELDALPGLSQKIQPTKEAIVPNGAGHGCGHNLMNAACAAAAVGMKAEMEAKNLPGTIVFYGCPAEEVLTGKVFMARHGAFKDLDCVFAWHGSMGNTVGLGGGNGLNSAVFHFKGRTAHAGGDPHNGRSALDAAELMSVGTQYLREHVTSDISIHYSYKEAGTAPNIVPDKASVWYYVRAFNRSAIEDTYNRLVKVAEGAAHMTETELEIEFLGGCYNTQPNMYMANMTYEIMKGVELPTYTEEELAFADALNKNSPNYQAVLASGKLEKGPIFEGMSGFQTTDNYGSTDVGDVQYIVPCVQVRTACWNQAAPGHSWQITACSDMGIGFKGMLYGAKVMAAAAMAMYEDPTHIEKAKAEFDEKMKAAPYKCPIPKEVPIPQPQK